MTTLGQHYDKLGQNYDINIQPGPACSQIGSCSYPSWDLRKKKAWIIMFKVSSGYRMFSCLIQEHSQWFVFMFEWLITLAEWGMGDPLGQPEFLLEQPRAREGTGLITVEYSILGNTGQRLELGQYWLPWNRGNTHDWHFSSSFSFFIKWRSLSLKMQFPQYVRNCLLKIKQLIINSCLWRYSNCHEINFNDVVSQF